jgi:RNA polymerase sigma-54 factor
MQHQNQVQTTTQRQNFFLIQQKLQLLNIMHLTVNALEEHIRMQIEENPALEQQVDSETSSDENLLDEERREHESRSMNDLETYYDDDDYPDYRTYVNNTSSDDDRITAPVAYQLSFQETLKDQLKEYNVKPELIPSLHYLIDSLDEDGLLRRPVEDLADDYGFAEGAFIEPAVLEEGLKIIQQLEPAGVGARDLRECLLLQLKRKTNPDPYAKIATAILEDHFQELTTKNFDKVIREMNITQEELREAFRVITHLTPRPVFTAVKGDSHSLSILPDFILNINDGQLEVSLASNTANTLKISEDFENYCHGKNQRKNATRKKFPDLSYYRKKVEEARWFIDALQQREKTLLDIIKAIATLQRDYFLTGDKKDLRPMILQNISDMTGYDLSTISRVTSNKYVQTPYGNILLKDVFSNAIHNEDGGEVSAKEIKQAIRELVEQEQKVKPLNDFDIVEQLREKGYSIARRTVVKYREAMNIPNARMRKAIC